MKVLFIGEGRHDVGDPGLNPNQPRAAQGTIPTLSRKVCSSISPTSVALAWTEIRRFNPAAKRRGYPAKVVAAVLLAVRKFGCAGTVVVADCDGDLGRREELQEGVNRAEQLFQGHPITWGLAIECVEAWTLGVPGNIAEELGVDLPVVQQQYPPSVSIESLSERSGREDHRPKRLLERIAQLNHKSDSTAFRQAIAERTDTAILEQACPNGFGPFASRMRETFGR